MVADRRLRAAASHRLIRAEAVPAGAAKRFIRLARQHGIDGRSLPHRRTADRLLFLAGETEALAGLLREARRDAVLRSGALAIEAALRCHDAPPRRLALRHGWLPLDRTLIMGVLNVTPDSFSDGGRHLAPRRAVAAGLRMAGEGADLIDIGGESTRPGAVPVPLAEELKRVLPVVEALAGKLRRRAGPRPLLSIDTMKAEVARRAAAAGADLINDISGLGHDPAMAAVVAATGLPVVLQHIQGVPRTMQRAPRYAGLLPEIAACLRRGIERALRAGVGIDRIVIDPGIGFGKRRRDNLALLRHLAALRSLGRPILIGASRKSFITGTTDRPVGQRLEGSLAAEALAIAGGADIIRAHDVLQAVRVARLCDAVLRTRDV